MRRRTRPLKPEPLAYLRVISYREYLQSDWWAMRSESYRDSLPDLRCECCNLGRPLPTKSGELYPHLPRFNVHHLSYERLGEETDDDLVLLCSICHNLVHYPDSHAARNWLELVAKLFGHEHRDLVERRAQALASDYAAIEGDDGTSLRWRRMS